MRVEEPGACMKKTKCNCCPAKISRWGHEPGCHPTTVTDVLFTVFCVVGFCVLFLGAAFGVLWIYASWGGSCLESGGHIVGNGTDTHCEGMKR